MVIHPFRYYGTTVLRYYGTTVDGVYVCNFLVLYTEQIKVHMVFYMKKKRTRFRIPYSCMFRFLA